MVVSKLVVDIIENNSGKNPTIETLHAAVNNYTKRQTTTFGAPLTAAPIVTLGADGNSFHMTGTIPATVTDFSHITGSGPFLIVTDIPITFKHTPGVLETDSGNDIITKVGTRLRLDQDSDGTTWLLSDINAIAEQTVNIPTIEAMRASANDFTQRQTFKFGGVIASADIMTLGTDGNSFHVSAGLVTTITDFNHIAGSGPFLLIADAILTFKHTPGVLETLDGKDVTTAINDRLRLDQDSDGTTWLLTDLNAATKPYISALTIDTLRANANDFTKRQTTSFGAPLTSEAVMTLGVDGNAFHIKPGAVTTVINITNIAGSGPFLLITDGPLTFKHTAGVLETDSGLNIVTKVGTRLRLDQDSDGATWLLSDMNAIPEPSVSVPTINAIHNSANDFTQRQTTSFGATLTSETVTTLGTDGNAFHIRPGVVTTITDFTHITGSGPFLLVSDGVLTFKHRLGVLETISGKDVVTKGGDRLRLDQDSDGATWLLSDFNTAPVVSPLTIAAIRNSSNDFTKRQTTSFGATLTSASVMALGVDGNAFHIIAGVTTTITDFTHITGSGPFLLITDDALTFKHRSGVLETDSGLNIITKPGTRLRLDQDSDGTTWLLSDINAVPKPVVSPLTIAAIRNSSNDFTQRQTTSFGATLTSAPIMTLGTDGNAFHIRPGVVTTITDFTHIAGSGPFLLVADSVLTFKHRVGVLETDSGNDIVTKSGTRLRLDQDSDGATWLLSDMNAIANDKVSPLTVSSVRSSSNDFTKRQTTSFGATLTSASLVTLGVDGNAFHIRSGVVTVITDFTHITGSGPFLLVADSVLTFKHRIGVLETDSGNDIVTKVGTRLRLDQDSDGTTWLLSDINAVAVPVVSPLTIAAVRGGANDFTKRQTTSFGATLTSEAVMVLGVDGNAFHIRSGVVTTITDFTHITGSGPFLLIADSVLTFKHRSGVLETDSGLNIITKPGTRLRLDQDSDGTTWLLSDINAIANDKVSTLTVAAIRNSSNDFTQRQTTSFGATLTSASLVTLGVDGNAFHIKIGATATITDFTHITGSGPFLLVADDILTFTHRIGVLETDTGLDIVTKVGTRLRLDQDSDGTTWLLSDMNVRPVTIPSIITTPNITLTSTVGGISKIIGTSAYMTSNSYYGQHMATDWELALTSSFTNPVISSYNNTVNLVSYSPPLSLSTTYYIRARHRSDKFISDWSIPVTHTTPGSRIDTPIVSVTGGPTSLTRKPIIFGGAFNVTGGTDTHVSTDWVIKDSTGAIINSSITDTVNLESYQMPDNLISLTSSYTFEVTYHGTTLASSAKGVGVATAPPVTLFGSRGLFGGGLVGSTTVSTMDYVTIGLLGNATAFGNLTHTTKEPTAVSDTYKGVYTGGTYLSISSIDYVNIITPSGAAVFGWLSVSRTGVGSVCNGSIGVFGGGLSNIYTTTMDYISVGATSSAIAFGALTTARYYTAGISSSSLGVFAGGFAISALSTMDYITIGTLGNAMGYSSLATPGYGIGTVSDGVRGVLAGGYGTISSSTISYITITTHAAAVNFGTLSVATVYLTGTSDGSMGIFGGGVGNYSVIDYITINTLGNATAFGLLTTSRTQMAATSGN